MPQSSAKLSTISEPRALQSEQKRKSFPNGFRCCFYQSKTMLFTPIAEAVPQRPPPHFLSLRSIPFLRIPQSAFLYHGYPDSPFCGFPNPLPISSVSLYIFADSPICFPVSWSDELEDNFPDNLYYEFNEYFQLPVHFFILRQVMNLSSVMKRRQDPR